MKMIPIIYDNPENEGIDLKIDFENGLSMNIFMDDDVAHEMIKVIQNKLNARL